MILILITASAVILSSGCYQDDGDSRVTIHLERYDLSSNDIKHDKRFIDRILELFSTPAEAGAFWSNVKTDLTISTGVRYYYRVSTVGTMGESILSDAVSGIR
jgi:hypothetical protein